MALGVQKTLETMADLERLAIDGIAIAKSPWGLGSVTKVFGFLSDVKELVEDAPGAIPELKDLDAAEAGVVMTRAYAMVQAIVKSVAA